MCKEKVLEGFFRLLEIDAHDVRNYPNGFARLRQGELQGIMLHNVYPAELLQRLIPQLASHNPPFLKTWFPDAFKSWFYGQNLNLADPTLINYFKEAPKFNKQLQSLLPANQGVIDYLAGLFAQLDHDRPFLTAPGIEANQEYMFCTIRCHLPGGFIPPHCENEYPRRPTYDHLRSIADSHIYSYVLALTLADEGGALEIFNHILPIANDLETSIQISEQRTDLAGTASVKFRIPAGSLLLFDSGRYLHQLTPIGGNRNRWTISSFMSMSQHQNAMFCWG